MIVERLLKKLRWRPRLSIKNSVKLTVEWHKGFLQKKFIRTKHKTTKKIYYKKFITLRDFILMINGVKIIQKK